MTNRLRGRASRVRRGMRLLVPPVVDVVVPRIRARRSPEWECIGIRWPSGPFRGWDVASVAERQALEWPQAAEASSGPGVLTDRGLAAHNTLMCFAYVLALTTRRRDALSILDWGSGVGTHALYAEALLGEVDIDYHCRDLPKVAAKGRRLNDSATFHDTDESALARTYDLVMASSSLQYAEHWQETLGDLAAATANWLYITRQPFVDKAASYVAVQHPDRSGYYDTEYPGWVLNRDEFLAAASTLELVLTREFLTGEGPTVAGAPEQPVYRGFLFRAGGLP